MRACEELGIATVAVYSELDRDALHARRADEAYLLGPGPRQRELPGRREDPRGRQGVGRRGDPPRLRLPGGERRLRARLRGGRHRLHRPAGRARSTPWAPRPRARELMQAAGVPIVPGTTEPVATVEDARKVIEETIGYPVAIKAAGGGGGKGFRVALEAGRARGGVRGREPRGREVLLRRHRLRRALPARPAPRRGAGAGRRARQRDPPVRARLLGAAPPPEADRGAPGARRRRRAARADRQDRHRRRRAPWATSARAPSRACSRTASTSSSR